MALIDLTFAPVVQALKDCYCTQLQLVSTPVADCCIRPGEVAYGISLTQDECCSGLGWVRVVNWGAGFPGPEEQPTRCLPTQWRLDLELGAVRCAPVGTAETLPTCEEWTAAHNLMMEDAMARRQAVAGCFATGDPNRLVSFGEWQPIGPEGRCVGGTLSITVEVLPCDECEEPAP